MGTITITRTADGQLTHEALKRWFVDTKSEMAEESGTDAYSGNWNANQGLRIVEGTFTEAEAEIYAEKNVQNINFKINNHIFESTK